MSMRHLLKRYNRKPDFQMEPLRARKVTLVLNGETGRFFAYRVGDRFLWIDYDYPGGVVKQYYDCETRARFSVNGEECLELHWDFYEKKGGRFALDGQSDSYVAVGERDVAEILWIHRDAKAPEGKPSGNIQIRRIVTPRRIKLGDRWRFVEHWFWKEAKARERITEEADGLFRVRIFAREHETLRIRSVKRGPKRSSMADSYVDLKTGLTVFFRRYNGPGWKNLDKLANEEKVAVGKTTFLHWYDSVPFRD